MIQRERVKDVYLCNDCCGQLTDVMGRLTCTKCGLVSDFYVYVPDLIYLMKKDKKVKSVHKRNKWFQKRVRGIVPPLMIEALTNDFIKVVNVLIEKKLIKKNVSRYSYYIIRLCSKNNVQFITANKKDIKKLQQIKLTDMKKGKTEGKFDNNLFGIVYKELGWEKTAKRNCKYYKKWLKR